MSSNNNKPLNIQGKPANPGKKSTEIPEPTPWQEINTQYDMEDGELRTPGDSPPLSSVSSMDEEVEVEDEGEEDVELDIEGDSGETKQHKQDGKSLEEEGKENKQLPRSNNGETANKKRQPPKKKHLK